MMENAIYYFSSLLKITISFFPNYWFETFFFFFCLIKIEIDLECRNRIAYSVNTDQTAPSGAG